MAYFTYGNKNSSYKLLQWNKGNSNIKNKYDDICMSINNIKPEFF